MFNILLSESIIQEELQEYAKKILDSLSHPNIHSVKNTNKNIVVRVNKLEELEELLTKITEAIGEEYSVESADKDALHIRKKGQIGKASIYFRQRLSEKNVVILKNLIAFLITGKPTSQMISILELDRGTTNSDIMDKIIENHQSLYDIAKFSKKLITDKISNIDDVQVSNTKADLIITDEEGTKHGISIKASPKTIINNTSMSLGYGDEENSLVPNSTAWFEQARDMFAKKLKLRDATLKKLIKAKADNIEIYRDVLKSINANIRKTFVTKLRKMNPSKLAEFVNNYRMGDEEERSGYKSFFKLTYDKRGVTLDRISKGKLDKDKLKLNGLTPKKVVKEVEGMIKIEIPNSQPLIIKSIGISNFLTDEKELLKVKTK
jgi:hypothetical protein